MKTLFAASLATHSLATASLATAALLALGGPVQAQGTLPLHLAQQSTHLAGGSANGRPDSTNSRNTYVSGVYVLTQWQVGERRVALGQSKLTLQFVDGKVAGFSGCNTYSASYIQRLDSLRFGPIAGTLKACPQPLMAQESRYLLALSRVNTVRMQGEQMVLFAGRERLTFSPALASSAPALPAGTWQLKAITIREVARNGTRTYDPQSRMRFTIAPDGSMSGNDGCNRFQGKLALNAQSATKLQFAGPVTSTRMMCPPETQSLYDMLGADQSGPGAAYTLSGNTLSLTRDGSQVWQFVRQ